MPQISNFHGSVRAALDTALSLRLPACHPPPPTATHPRLHGVPTPCRSCAYGKRCALQDPPSSLSPGWQIGGRVRGVCVSERVAGPQRRCDPPDGCFLRFFFFFFPLPHPPHPLRPRSQVGTNPDDIFGLNSFTQPPFVGGLGLGTLTLGDAAVTPARASGPRAARARRLTAPRAAARARELSEGCSTALTAAGPAHPHRPAPPLRSRPGTPRSRPSGSRGRLPAANPR